MPRGAADVWPTGQAGEWTEETRPELDQLDAQFQPDRGQAVASGVADTLNESSGAELAEVIAKLAEAIVIGGEMMASDHACVQLASCPVADEAAGMEQRFQQADDAVIAQFEAGDTALPDQCWRSQCGELASIDHAGQQLGLLRSPSSLRPCG